MHQKGGDKLDYYYYYGTSCSYIVIENENTAVTLSSLYLEQLSFIEVFSLAYLGLTVD